MTTPPRRYGDLARIIGLTTDNLDYAYSKGLMTLYARSAPGRSVRLRDGRLVVDFARGSYLGLDNHPAIVKGAIDALQEYQSLQWSGARTRLNFAIMEELETRLSDLFQARALVFSLVLTANMGIMPLIASGALTGGERPVVVFDKFAHATLSYHKPVVADHVDVVTLKHNDVGTLEALCKQGRPVLYIADGVYSMGGSATISDLILLQEKYGLFLYIDDAHGVSIYGRRGEGYARSSFGDTLGDRTIVAASLSKGFGTNGGVLMLGTAEQEKLIRRYAVPHTFSMGPDIPSVGAAIASAKIHDSPELGERQQRLRAIIDEFDRNFSTDQSGAYLPIRMVSIGNEASAIDCADWILRQGYYVVPAIFPGVPRSEAALRICLTADHTPADVLALCSTIKDWKTTKA
jgi:7-keto-8-aminopelargonate synthetase-like enzyme